MYQLLIIADDFTGALDTGVQLSHIGAHTYVLVGDVSALKQQLPDVDVLVIDAETRHLSAADAYRVVYDITAEAVRLGIPHIFKKTDSALRGNIGSELSAVLDASGEQHLAFIPAYPQIGRTTENGIHFINHIRVAESVFGTDPYEPVKHSDIAELIRKQSPVLVKNLFVPSSATFLPTDKSILVFDSYLENDLTTIADFLVEKKLTHIMAGCAGFGGLLQQILHLPTKSVTIPSLDPRLLVICGSVNPITVKQLDNAESTGFKRIHLTPAQKLCDGYWDTKEGEQDLEALKMQCSLYPHLIIDSNDLLNNQPTTLYANEHNIDLTGIRLGISQSIGRIAKELFTNVDLGTLLITGGDTLLQCMLYMGIHSLEPICNFEPGIVLSRFHWKNHAHYILTKSGGFGSENFLSHITDVLDQQKSKQKKDATIKGGYSC